MGSIVEAIEHDDDAAVHSEDELGTLAATFNARRAETHEATARLEEALREINALQTALDRHSILSVTDRTGRIIEANAGFCQVSGYTREELLGQDHRLVNSGVHPKSFWSSMWRTVCAGEAWRSEVCNRHKDGTLYWVDSTIVPMCDGDGRPVKFVSIRFDITARKKIMAELDEARASAESANAAKSVFLANMSHEIRTPMTAILGFADLLSEFDSREHSVHERRTHVETIKRNGEHLLSIINDILDLSKIEAGKMSVEKVPTDPRAVLQEVIDLMSVKAQAKGITLESIIATPVPVQVHSDPVRLRQVLVNLVGNAIKFTEMGRVRVLLSSRGAVVRYEVRDTGIGMDEEQVESLFGAFQQADPST
ncbi:MAG: PAS domain-containing protein, partial [Phycisphaerales bacterium]|nr:PAS domain-containing protein [Phycisphaerales bacterium]